MNYETCECCGDRVYDEGHYCGGGDFWYCDECYVADDSKEDFEE